MKNRNFFKLSAVCNFILCLFILTACNQTHEHAYSAYTIVDDTYHSKTCSCGELQTEIHNFSENTCELCGYVKGTDGLVYTRKYVNGQEYYALTKNTTDEKDIKIASHINSIPVVEISDGAFLNNNIISVKIPNTLTTIGEKAFYGCNYLSSIEIGSSVSHIGANCFYNCRNLSYVSFMGNVDNWCNITFDNVSANPSVQTNNIYINGQILKELIMPENIVEIKNYAFYGFSRLERIICNENLQSIGNMAFYECYSVKELILNDTLSSIGNSAFEYCHKITSISIPDNVQRIENRAFFYCSNLYEVSIGKSLLYLADDAFSYCDKLIEIYNKSNLPISGYENIYTPYMGTKKLHTVNNYIFYCDENDIYLVGCTEFTPILALPDNYNNQNYKIYKMAFAGRNELNEVHIGEGVIEIGDEAFAYCNFLHTVHIGENVKKIGERAFYRIKNIYYTGTIETWCAMKFHHPFSFCSYNLYLDNDLIKDLVIPNGTNILSEEIFAYCNSIENITLPVSLTRIEYGALWDCMNLKSITYMGSIEQWNKVDIQPNWKGNTPISKVHCLDGDISFN